MGHLNFNGTLSCVQQLLTAANVTHRYRITVTMIIKKVSPRELLWIVLLSQVLRVLNN